jgi:hypothetical protein
MIRIKARELSHRDAIASLSVIVPVLDKRG